MSASQNRIAETVELFYTADKASDVRTCHLGMWLAIPVI